MTNEVLQEAKEIEKSLKYLHERLKDLHDPSKVGNLKDFYIKGCSAEIEACYYDGSNYKYPVLKIKLSREQSKFIWQQTINQIRAEIHKLETKLSKL